MKQELTRCQNGEEKRFVLATNEQKIKAESAERIGEVLRLVMLKVGLRIVNLPAPAEKAVLLMHIITEYGNHTLEEIKLAFDLAISGKLELKEVSCYENFSCLYFSTIMNAYRVWAKETYKQTKIDVPAIEGNKTEMTEEEKTEWINEWRIKDSINMVLIPLPFYDWLSLANYEKYLERSMGYCKQNLIANDNRTLSEFKRQETDGFEGEFKTLIINTAKRMAIFHELRK